MLALPSPERFNPTEEKKLDPIHLPRVRGIEIVFPWEEVNKEEQDQEDQFEAREDLNLAEAELDLIYQKVNRGIEIWKKINEEEHEDQDEELTYQKVIETLEEVNEEEQEQEICQEINRTSTHPKHIGVCERSFPWEVEQKQEYQNMGPEEFNPAEELDLIYQKVIQGITTLEERKRKIKRIKMRYKITN